MAISKEQSEIRLTIPLETPSAEPQSAAKPKGFRTRQLAALAVAFKEPLDGMAMEVYLTALSDLTDEQIQIATTRAIRELKFFPRVAELRELAGAAGKDQRSVEAEAAWKFANDYLRKWGVDRMPLFRSGKTIEAPALPPRIDYALRRIGGLRGLNQITEENRPFMFKDFCEAYNLAPIAEGLAPQLTAQFGPSLLDGSLRQLTDGKAMERPREKQPAEPRAKPKPIPQPLTDAQRRDRREILRQQMEMLKTRTEGEGPRHQGTAGGNGSSRLLGEAPGLPAR